MSRLPVFLLAVLAVAGAGAQTGAPARRLTTVEALREFASYYHLQNVVLRGELVESGNRLVLRSDDHEMRAVLNDGVTSRGGTLEVRGQLVDVGRLEPGDPRAASEARGVPGGATAEAERWPRPGDELFVRVTRVTEAQPATIAAASVRAVALEPWRFEGQAVTVTGNFRGRNLFGDLPGAPGKTRYDFVLRGADGAIWVTGLRPRGRGFNLDVDRRVDSGRWLQVTGTVSRDRGLVLLQASALALAEAPDVGEVAEEPDPPAPPPPPVEVVFSSPTESEADVRPDAPIRIQFSRGLDEKTIPGGIRVSYVGGPAVTPGTPAAQAVFTPTYDGATRAIELRMAEPMIPFRTVRVEVLDTLRGFDGAPVTPWTLSFSVGG